MREYMASFSTQIQNGSIEVFSRVFAWTKIKDIIHKNKLNYDDLYLNTIKDI